VAAVLAGQALPLPITGAEVLAGLRRFRLRLSYDSLWFIFLFSAAIFQALLVFDGRYRDAPTPVFIIPVMAAVLRFWCKDQPRRLGWEEIAAALTLAGLALADMAIEGPRNLPFMIWNIEALILAAPVLATLRPTQRS
jgi:hypothetical protein